MSLVAITIVFKVSSSVIAFAVSLGLPFFLVSSFSTEGLDHLAARFEQFESLFHESSRVVSKFSVCVIAQGVVTDAEGTLVG